MAQQFVSPSSVYIAVYQQKEIPAFFPRVSDFVRSTCSTDCCTLGKVMLSLVVVIVCELALFCDFHMFTRCSVRSRASLLVLGSGGDSRDTRTISV